LTLLMRSVHHVGPDLIHMTENRETTEDGRAPRTPCPKCGQREVVLGTKTEDFVYLRCSVCSEVWSFPERRNPLHVRRRVATGGARIIDEPDSGT